MRGWRKDHHPLSYARKPSKECKTLLSYIHIADPTALLASQGRAVTRDFEPLKHQALEAFPLQWPLSLSGTFWFRDQHSSLQTGQITTHQRFQEQRTFGNVTVR